MTGPLPMLSANEAAKQAIRMRRLFAASAFSVLFLLVLLVFHINGKVDRSTLIDTSLLVLAMIAAFYALMRSGLNQRMADPSLTAAQMACSIGTMLFVLYRAPETRLAFGAFFFVSFMFGMLRLEARRLAIMAVVSLAALAILVWLRYAADNDIEALRLDVLHWTVLSLTMPWFLVIGDYIKRLRMDLAETSNRLGDFEEQARRDELTGLYNRRALMTALQRAKELADQRPETFSLAVIDIDYFKKVNDEIGHLAGDELLRRFAEAVRESLRASDIFGRYGGEEFVQIMPGTGLEGARNNAERLRQRVEALDNSGFALHRPITVSVGVAEYRPREAVLQTFSRADSALYRAKQAGRNRVVCSE